MTNWKACHSAVTAGHHSSTAAAVSALLSVGCLCPKAQSPVQRNTAEPTKELTCTVTPPPTEQNVDLVKLSYAFRDGYVRRLAMLNSWVPWQHRVFSFGEEAGFATFNQRVRACRLVFSLLPLDQAVAVAQVASGVVVSVGHLGRLADADEVAQIGPSFVDLARALGRFLVTSPRRSVVVFASGEEGLTAGKEIATLQRNSSIIPLEDMEDTVATLPSDVDLVVIIAHEAAAAISALRSAGLSVDVALVTDVDARVPMHEGLLRVVSFAQDDPELDTRVANQLDPGSETAALGFDAALLAAAVLRNDLGAARSRRPPTGAISIT